MDWTDRGDDDSWVNVTGYPISVCDAAGNVVMEIGDAATVVTLAYEGEDRILRRSHRSNVPVTLPYHVRGYECLFKGRTVPLRTVAPVGSYLICTADVGPLLASLPYDECPFGVLVPNTYATDAELRAHRWKRAYGAHSFVRSMVQLKKWQGEAPPSSPSSTSGAVVEQGEVVADAAAAMTPRRRTTPLLRPAMYMDTNVLSESSSVASHMEVTPIPSRPATPDGHQYRKSMRSVTVDESMFF